MSLICTMNVHTSIVIYVVKENVIYVVTENVTNLYNECSY